MWSVWHVGMSATDAEGCFEITVLILMILRVSVVTDSGMHLGSLARQAEASMGTKWKVADDDWSQKSIENTLNTRLSAAW